MCRKEKTKIRLEGGRGGVNGTLIDQYIKGVRSLEVQARPQVSGVSPMVNKITSAYVSECETDQV